MLLAGRWPWGRRHKPVAHDGNQFLGARCSQLSLPTPSQSGPPEQSSPHPPHSHPSESQALLPAVTPPNPYKSSPFRVSYVLSLSRGWQQKSRDPSPLSSLQLPGWSSPSFPGAMKSYFYSAAPRSAQQSQGLPRETAARGAGGEAPAPPRPHSPSCPARSWPHRLPREGTQLGPVGCPQHWGPRPDWEGALHLLRLCKERWFPTFLGKTWDFEGGERPTCDSTALPVENKVNLFRQAMESVLCMI